MSRASATTPLRIVYHCSFKSSPQFASLNDALLTGQKLQNDICQILLAFRFKEFALIGDIAKAFHMIYLKESDRKFTRFLWVDKDNPENIIPFEFCRILFGAKSSPYILNSTVQKHLGLNPCEISETIQKKMVKF